MKKHLLYSIYPRKDNIEWIMNILELKVYANCFDECHFILREDETTFDDIDFIYNILSPFQKGNALIYSVKNHKTLGETYAFIDYLKGIIHKDGITFYAHTKGVTHTAGKRLDAIRIWRQQMYAANLYNMMKTELALSKYVCAGAFRMKGAWPQFPDSKWCFAGNYWWINNERLREKQYQNIGNDNYAVEGYLGKIIPHEESYCLFEDECKRDLYQLEAPKRILYKCKQCKWDSYVLTTCVYCYKNMEESE